MQTMHAGVPWDEAAKRVMEAMMTLERCLNLEKIATKDYLLLVHDQVTNYQGEFQRYMQASKIDICGLEENMMKHKRTVAEKDEEILEVCRKNFSIKRKKQKRLGNVVRKSEGQAKRSRNPQGGPQEGPSKDHYCPTVMQTRQRKKLECQKASFNAT